MIGMKRFLAAGACAFAALAAQGAAAQVSSRYTFIGTVAGDPGNLFTGSFTLRETGGAYTLTAFSGTYRTDVFNLGNTGLFQIPPNEVIIGGTDDGGPLSVTGNIADFSMDFDAVTKGPGAANFNYVSYAGGGGLPTVSYAYAVAAPEPASWGLLILGFGVAGAALKRRRKLAVGAAALALG